MKASEGTKNGSPSPTSIMDSFENGTFVPLDKGKGSPTSKNDEMTDLQQSQRVCRHLKASLKARKDQLRIKQDQIDVLRGENGSLWAKIRAVESKTRDWDVQKAVMEDKIRSYEQQVRSCRDQLSDCQAKARHAQQQADQSQELLGHYRALSQHTGYQKWSKEIRGAEAKLAKMKMNID